MGETKQCPNCGKELKETAKYCGACGYRFQDIMDVQQEQIKPAAPAAKPEEKHPKRSKEKEQQAPKQQTERPRIGLVIALTLIAVVVIGGFVMFLDNFYRSALAAQEAEERGRREEEDETTEAEEEEEEEEKEHVVAQLTGTSLKTENGEYYFLKEGDVYFFISEQTENYIKGSVSIHEMTKEEIEQSEAAGIENTVRNADFYRVDAVVSQELYYGSKRSGNVYTMYVATNGQTAAIYDSGWSDYYMAEVGDLAERGRLEAYFPKDPSGTVEVVTQTNTAVVTGTDYAVADIRFDGTEAKDDSCYIISVDDGSSRFYVFKYGDYFQSTLYAADEPGDINNAWEFLTVEEGSFIGTFLADDEYLYYTVGHEFGDDNYVIDSLCRMNLKNKQSEELVRDEVEDFSVSDDAVYYTDYSRLVRIDKVTRKAEEIWSYGVYCYEISDDMLFVYDGEAWEIIDPVDGEEYGYVIDRVNYAYESDVVQIESNMIFHVAYDYDAGTVALHAIDIQNGREYTIGEAYDGQPSDTYNVFYSGKYVYFSVNDWEGIARVDVTNGESRMISFADEGYYYFNEFSDLFGTTVLHVYDDQLNDYLLQMDADMNLTLIR